MGLFTDKTEHPRIRLARVTGKGADQMLAAYDPDDNIIIMNVVTLSELTDDGIIMCLNHELCHWAQTMFLSRTEILEIRKNYNPDDHIMERAMPEEFIGMKAIYYQTVFDMFKRMLGVPSSLNI